ncbi:NAD(P)H-binding protein [Streptomyces olivaceoviridis]
MADKGGASAGGVRRAVRPRGGPRAGRGGGCRCGNRGSGPRRPGPIAGDRAGPGGWDERDRGLPCRGPGRAGAGQAGRAVTTEARARGYAVTAVVRNPAAGYPHLGAEGVTVVRGDVTDPRSVAGTAAGHIGGRARRLAVQRAGAGARHARSRVLREGGGRAARRTRRGRCGSARRGGTGGEPARRGRAAGDGRPGRVPDGNPAVRAGAHGRPAPTAGARGRPRRPGDADARRAPGARRCPDGAVPHRGERLPGDGPEPWLSYADLAVAVVDEIERPVRHRTRVSVFNFRSEEG